MRGRLLHTTGDDGVLVCESCKYMCKCGCSVDRTAKQEQTDKYSDQISLVSTSVVARVVYRCRFKPCKEGGVKGYRGGSQREPGCVAGARHAAPTRASTVGSQ